MLHLVEFGHWSCIGLTLANVATKFRRNMVNLDRPVVRLEPR